MVVKYENKKSFIGSKVNELADKLIRVCEPVA